MTTYTIKIRTLSAALVCEVLAGLPAANAGVTSVSYSETACDFRFRRLRFRWRGSGSNGWQGLDPHSGKSSVSCGRSYHQGYSDTYSGRQPSRLPWHPRCQSHTSCNDRDCGRTGDGGTGAGNLCWSCCADYPWHWSRRFQVKCNRSSGGGSECNYHRRSRRDRQGLSASISTKGLANFRFIQLQASYLNPGGSETKSPLIDVDPHIVNTREKVKLPLPINPDQPDPNFKTARDYTIMAGGSPTTSTTLAFIGEENGVRTELPLAELTKLFVGTSEFDVPFLRAVDDVTDLYVAVDLTQWLSSPAVFSEGDIFSFLDGISPDLPGFLVSTSPITGFLDFTISSGYSGQAIAVATIDGQVLPEPASITLLVISILGVLSLRLRTTHTHEKKLKLTKSSYHGIGRSPRPKPQLLDPTRPRCSPNACSVMRPAAILGCGRGNFTESSH